MHSTQVSWRDIPDLCQLAWPPQDARAEAIGSILMACKAVQCSPSAQRARHTMIESTRDQSPSRYMASEQAIPSHINHLLA